jgi:hypothetical protein
LRDSAGVSPDFAALDVTPDMPGASAMLAITADASTLTRAGVRWEEGWRRGRTASERDLGGGVEGRLRAGMRWEAGAKPGLLAANGRDREDPEASNR